MGSPNKLIELKPKLIITNYIILSQSHSVAWKLHHEMEVFEIWLWRCWVSSDLRVAKSSGNYSGLVSLASFNHCFLLESFPLLDFSTTLSCSLPISVASSLWLLWTLEFLRVQPCLSSFLFLCFLTLKKVRSISWAWQITYISPS